MMGWQVHTKEEFQFISKHPCWQQKAQGQDSKGPLQPGWLPLWPRGRKNRADLYHFHSHHKEGASLGTYHSYYFTVNLHAPVCSETSEPLDPAASASHWGSLGMWAGPSILLGGGTSALQHSTGHYGAGRSRPNHMSTNEDSLPRHLWAHWPASSEFQQ